MASFCRTIKTLPLALGSVGCPTRSLPLAVPSQTTCHPNRGGPVIQGFALRRVGPFHLDFERLAGVLIDLDLGP